MKPADRHTRVGVYVLIIYEGKILLTRKKAGPYKGFWDFPGGGIEFSESPLETLQRELREEAALSITNPQLFTILSAHGEYNNASYHYLAIIYRVSSFTPLNIPPEDESQWFNLPPTQTTLFVIEALSQLYGTR